MSNRRCYEPNIKTLLVPVSDKKNFEVGHLCSYILTCNNGAGPVLTLGKSCELGRDPQDDAIH